MKGKYLDGELIYPILNSEFKKHIGKCVEYLRECDIDRSGRGYIFPRYGTITGAIGKNLYIDDTPIWMSDIREIAIRPTTP